MSADALRQKQSASWQLAAVQMNCNNHKVCCPTCKEEEFCGVGTWAKGGRSNSNGAERARLSADSCILCAPLSLPCKYGDQYSSCKFYSRVNWSISLNWKKCTKRESLSFEIFYNQQWIKDFRTIHKKIPLKLKILQSINKSRINYFFVLKRETWWSSCPKTGF